ncbi:MAG TPA: hypothetical protein VHE83_00590 [Mycobacteriales bacterium]|nr:hypothetical protein [Mycobacteriales bacterium]
MDLTPDADQTALIDAARSMLAERMPSEALRATFTRPSAIDPTFWSACARPPTSSPRRRPRTRPSR